MRFTVHNVGHGFCASLVKPNGDSLLWDCGHLLNSKPSQFLKEIGATTIKALFISNYDEDHISDIVALRQSFNIETLYKNPSISPEQLKNIKQKTGPISPAMKETLGMLEYYREPISVDPFESFSGVSINTFYNELSSELCDTNNLSLVSVLSFAGHTILMPGDLEFAGWEALLTEPQFTRILSDTSILVASHHGRENGYHPGVFKHATKIRAVIFSDSTKKFATQEMTGTYRAHAQGILLNDKLRRVVTTRSDGDISIDG